MTTIDRHDAAAEWPEPIADDRITAACSALAAVDAALAVQVERCLRAYATMHPMLPPPDVLRALAPSLMHALGDNSGDGQTDPAVWLASAAEHEAQHGPLLLASAPITANFARRLTATPGD